MDVSLFLPVFLSSSLVAIVALICSAFLYVSDSTLKLWVPRLIAVAVGVLLGDAFLHLLPDALELSETSSTPVFLATLFGILCFYFVEQSLQWRHYHSAQLSSSKQSSVASFSKMNLLGDGIHNFVDGVLIASSFLVDPAIGVATTLAIVLHEIPQEISDIAVLIQGGYSRKQAVRVNFICATACILGAMVTLMMSQFIELGLSAMLAFTAGGFIYIATCDLVPLLRSHELKVGLPTQVVATLAGVASMQSILWLENIT